jgi:hypothetical protein
MPVSKQISGVKEVETENGTTYEIQYFVMDSDLASYVPEIGSIASWAPVPAKVTEYTKDPVGNDTLGCHILTISAAPEEDDESGGGSFDREKLDKNLKPNYGMTDLYLPADWWGIRKAAKDDVQKKIKNIHDAACALDDFVFRDATASNKGAATYKKSPFLDSSTIDIAYVERKVKIALYSVTFYTRAANSALSLFQGVNPTNGFPRGHEPVKDFSTEAGKWLADDQQVEPVLNRKRVKYWRVTRSMKYAPGTLKWDPAKNLGTWRYRT